MSPAVTSPSLFTMSESFFGSWSSSFEFHLLEVEDDVGHVLDHAWKRGELMLRACDFYCSDGSAFQRGKQDAPEGIPYGVPIAGLKRLGGEFGVCICGCALVFGESFRHFKTTVTDWHMF